MSSSSNLQKNSDSNEELTELSIEDIQENINDYKLGDEKNYENKKNFNNNEESSSCSTRCSIGSSSASSVSIGEFEIEDKHNDDGQSSKIENYVSSDSENFILDSTIEGTPDPYQILYAAKKNQAKEIRKLSSKGANVNVQNSEGQTSLHISVINENIDCVLSLLVCNEINPNIQDVVGNTPLHIACKMALPLDTCTPKLTDVEYRNDALDLSSDTTSETIATMIMRDKRTDLNCLDGSGLTPLLIATIIGSVKIVSRLIDAGADVNLKGAKIPALCIAVENGFADIVHVLLQNNAKTNLRDEKGYTPLHIACEKNYFDIVKLLKEYGASTSSELPGSKKKPHQLTTDPEIIDYILGHRTSLTHPLRINYINCDELGQGKMAFSMCPGRNKKIHRRDVDIDIDALISAGVNVMVSLVRLSEMESMGIPDMLDKVRNKGIEVIHAPIRDKWIPSSMDFLINLVNNIVRRIKQGKFVLIHCNGGKGRSGLIAVCTLVALGMSPSKGTSLVRSVKNGMLYNPAQIIYIKAFYISIRSKKKSRKSNEELIELGKTEEIEENEENEDDSEYSSE